MRFARFAVALIPLASVLTTIAAAQGQGVLTDDASVSSLTPKTNYGSSIALLVCSGSNSYLKFSLANLPSGVNGNNIAGATAVLYVDAVLASGAMDVYQVAAPWSEGTITFNNAPALGSKILSAVPVSKAGYLSINLTSTVQSWLNSTLANNGIALVPTSGSAISVSFDSKENILTSHAAQLNLVLVSAGVQGPQGPQGLQGQTGPPGPVGPPGSPPPNTAVTNATNIFSGAQTINGNLILSGAGNGVQFADGSTQTTAATGAGSVVPSGYMILSTSATAPPGYTLTGYRINDPGNPAWSVLSPLTNSGQYVSACSGVINGFTYNWALGGFVVGDTLLQPLPPMPLQRTSNVPMATPAVASGAACIGGKVYSIGGAANTAAATALGTNQIFDIASATWGTGSAMPTPRAGLGVATVNGLIYAIGGITSNFITGSVTSTVEVYNPSTDSWSTGTPLPQGLCCFGVAVSNGTIYVIGGGTDNTTVNTVYSFNPATDSAWSSKSSLPTGRQWLGASADANGTIYAVGGADANSNVTGETDVYTPSTNAWVTVAPMPTPTEGEGVLAFGQGTVYTYQGFNSSTPSASTALVQSFNYPQYVPSAVFYVFLKN